MSSMLPDVLARIQQLTPQAPAAAQAAQTAAPTTSFSDALAQASTPTATTTSSDASSAAPYLADIDTSSQKYGVDPLLLQSLIQQESGFDPNATSAAGAQGLTQLMPSTAAGLGVTNPYDPAQAIDGGAHYLADQLAQFGGNTSSALAAYNAGPGAVKQYGGVPPYAETQAYVQNILARYQQLATGGGS